jgi:hypothetical protein
MDAIQFFLSPDNPDQRKYEALRAFYLDGKSGKEVVQKFGYTPAYFKKIRFEFNQQLKSGEANPFFPARKTGPKKSFTRQDVTDQIIALRKQNYSILDIRAALVAKNRPVSHDTIDKILKAEGFATLPRRTKQEKQAIALPPKMTPPKSRSLIWQEETFYTERGAGPLIFLPLIEQLGIIPAIQKCGFPSTQTLTDVASIMAFLSLKISGCYRMSHDEMWGLDRALGLCAKLNVLPKSSTLSSYSYRVSRSMNRQLLLELSRIFKDPATDSGDFNLDFKTIPYWGDEKVLEKNWAGSRSKALKSVLALIVQEPASGFLSYSDAEIKHSNQNEAIIEFVDFWTEGRATPLKMLIFDSKLTTYKNLNKLNQSKPEIKFLTLRRRGKVLIDKTLQIPKEQWQAVKIDKVKRKHKNLKVYEEFVQLKDYKGRVRQIIITNHGRKNPTFLITNDHESPLKTLILKYARRWLIENEITEQILFFHLNQLSSSIVVKVDFDLTLSLLTHNLYKQLCRYLPGFEMCTIPTIHRKFIENGAKIIIADKTITVRLKKKNHLPILFELPWMNKETHLTWLDMNIRFEGDTSS